MGSGHSVESVVVPLDKTANIAVTGTLGGTVAAWDLSSQIVRTSMKVGEGVTCLAMAEDQIVYAGTLDGAIRSVDMRTGTPVRMLSCGTLYVRLKLPADVIRDQFNRAS